MGGGHDRPATGEHPGELGRHDEIGGAGPLGEEVDVRGVEEDVEVALVLQGEHGYVGTAGDERFEAAAECSFAAEDEVDFGLSFKGVGEWGEALYALLVSHVAGVKNDGLAHETQILAKRVRVARAEGEDGFRVYPVGEQQGAGGLGALGDCAGDHLRRDAGDSREAMSKEALRGEGQAMYGAAGLEQVKVEGGVHLEILDVEPGWASRKGCDGESDGCTAKGGLDGDDDVGSPGDLAEHLGDAERGEGQEMGDAGASGGVEGDVEGGSIDGRATRRWCGLHAVEGAAIFGVDPPVRVVGRARHDAHFVAYLGEMVSPVSGVFSDAGELGREVQTIDQDAKAGGR